MNTKVNRTESLPMRVIASLLVLVCVVLGIIGLVVPLIPGVLFLAIAAVLVVRRFPSLRLRLSHHGAIGRHLDRTDAFLDLPLPAKLQVGAWFCVKLVLDGLALVESLVTKLLSPAPSKG